MLYAYMHMGVVIFFFFFDLKFKGLLTSNEEDLTWVMFQNVQFV